MFRGRELSHPELGMAVLTRFAEELKETASIEKAAKLEGRNMTMKMCIRDSHLSHG